MTDPFSPQAQEHIPRSVACVVAVDASGVTTEASSTPGPAYSAWIIINQHIPEHRTVSSLAISTVLSLRIIQTGGISAHSIAPLIEHLAIRDHSAIYPQLSLIRPSELRRPSRTPCLSPPHPIARLSPFDDHHRPCRRSDSTTRQHRHHRCRWHRRRRVNRLRQRGRSSRTAKPWNRSGRSCGPRVLMTSFPSAFA